jgi:hypothetical protein
MLHAGASTVQKGENLQQTVQFASAAGPSTLLGANPLFTYQRAATPINPRHVSHLSHQRIAIIVP